MNELEKMLNLYEETFDDSFPMFSFMGTEENDVISIIKKCVDAKKDVYEMGYLTLDEDVMY